MNLPLGWTLNIINAPTVEPVSLDEAKEFARIQVDDDDAMIEGLISSARATCEQMTGRVFLPTQFELILSQPPLNQLYGGWGWSTCDSSVSLPWSPLISLDSFTYTSLSGIATQVDPSRLVVVPGSPGRIAPPYGSFWPLSLPQLGSVRIRYTSGYADTYSVPANLKTAIKALVYFMYDHATEDAPIPTYINSLLLPFKVYGFQ